MKKLTQKEILSMTNGQRKDNLNLMQDKACNIDYLLQPDLSDIVQHNIHLLESKIEFSEY